MQTLPGFAGVWIDQLRQGLPVFAFTGDVDRAHIAARLPADTLFEVVRVARSWKELLATKDRVVAAWSDVATAGTDIVSVGLSASDNAVVVGVRGDVDLADRLLKADFGPGVAAIVGYVGQADACISMAECWGPRGGFNVDPCTSSVASCTTNSAYGAQCTSGFLVRRQSDNALGLITAGHCLVRSAQGPSGSGGTSAGQGTEWRHNQHLLGQAGRNTWFNGSGADVGYIGIYSNRWPTVKNDFVYDDSPTYIDQVDAAPNWGLQSEGELVCRVGRNSGRTCGDILRTDEAHLSCLNVQLNCRTIDHEYVVDFDSTGGDSGGPVFTLAVYVEAYGIHTGWYSTLSMARAQYNTTAGALLNVCTTASC